MNKHQATVVTFGNFKGGTGKTTNSTMIAYCLSKMGYKVLLSDQDPQSNATDLFLKTKAHYEEDVTSFEKTLMSAIKDGDLSSIVTEIRPNLYLLPSFTDFSLYPKYLEIKFENEEERVKYISTLFEPLRQEFDFIFIDVPPTISIYTDSALYASDYVVVVLQTQERSLQGAEMFTNYLQKLIDDYDADFDIIGILPVLLKNQSNVDISVLENAKEIFNEQNVFKNVVRHMERLKRFDITGIVEEDMHDRRVIDEYTVITKEFLERWEHAESEA